MSLVLAYPCTMKSPTRSIGDGSGKLLRIGRKEPANRAALRVLQEVTEFVRANPDVETVVVMVGRAGFCRPFATPIDNPLDFIGMLELMKHDLFREK